VWVFIPVLAASQPPCWGGCDRIPVAPEKLPGGLVRSPPNMLPGDPDHTSAGSCVRTPVRCGGGIVFCSPVRTGQLVFSAPFSVGYWNGRGNDPKPNLPLDQIYLQLFQWTLVDLTEYVGRSSRPGPVARQETVRRFCTRYGFLFVSLRGRW